MVLRIVKVTPTTITFSEPVLTNGVVGMSNFSAGYNGSAPTLAAFAGPAATVGILSWDNGDPVPGDWWCQGLTLTRVFSPQGPRDCVCQVGMVEADA